MVPQGVATELHSLHLITQILCPQMQAQRNMQNSRPYGPPDVSHFLVLSMELLGYKVGYPMLTHTRVC